MREPNKKGCIPTEDVCLKHGSPLECKHGCGEALPHKCEEWKSWATENPKPDLFLAP